MCCALPAHCIRAAPVGVDTASAAGITSAAGTRRRSAWRRSCPRSPLAPTLAPHAPLQAEVHATTILSVRKGDSLFIIGDGQVSLGSQIIKPNARKVRKLKDGVMAGFAGATADAMTLFERLEMKLSEHPETMRACVEMAKAWRMDK